MNDTLQDLMRAATRLTGAGRLKDATAAIQRALNQPAVPQTAAHGTSPSNWGIGRGLHNATVPAAVAPGVVLDGCVFEAPSARPTPTAQSTPSTTSAPSAPHRPEPAAGAFISGTHQHASLTRAYKLYLPPGPAAAAGTALRPLVVMLHGCTQDPDDFAVGTGMNERAREQGFVVLYPAQARDANPSRCWNWFKHNHQQRGRGEPALIASLVQTVIRQHGIDPARVYVAGLSAGGAMASILAGAYPEMFAAVGVHSGLARGAAGNLPEALAAMNGSAAASVAATTQTAVPTIVFHGDQDSTVHPRNGEQVVQAALGDGAHSATVDEIGAAQGRRCTRRVHRNAQGAVQAEHWLVHGCGHAWSGGSAEGSYTDRSGPDASGEMLRFFFEHPRRPTH